MNVHTYKLDCESYVKTGYGCIIYFKLGTSELALLAFLMTLKKGPCPPSKR